MSMDVNASDLDRFIVERLKDEEDVLAIIRIGSSVFDPKSKDLDYGIIIRDVVPSPKLFKKVKEVQEEVVNKFDLVPAVQGMGSKYEKKTFDIIFVSGNDIAINYLPLPPAIGVVTNGNYLVIFEREKGLYERIRRAYLESLERLNKGVFIKDYILLSAFREVPIIVYVYFLLPSLGSGNKEALLWFFKISLYPCLYYKGIFPRKEELIDTLRKEYDFMDRIFNKYKIPSDIFVSKVFNEGDLAYALYEIIIETAKRLPEMIRWDK